MKTLKNLFSAYIIPIITLVTSVYVAKFGDFIWEYPIFITANITVINTFMLFLCPQTLSKANPGWFVLGAMVNCLSINSLLGKGDIIFGILALIAGGYTILGICFPALVNALKKFEH